jgi:hypothetical protein
MPATLLVVNGFVSLLIGFFCGRPLAGSIKRGGSDQQVHAWRVAHSSLVSGGLMLLAIAGVWGHVALSNAAQWAVSSALSLSMYAFGYALVVGAWKGYRGLGGEQGSLGRSIYASNVAGAALSTVSLVAASCGALRTLLQ